MADGEQVAATAEQAVEQADPTTKIENPNAEVVERAEPAAEVSEVVETDDSETEGDKPDGKKRVPGSQRLKNRLKLIEADYLAQQSELEALRRERQQTQQPQQDGKPGVDREPKETDFPNDWFSFQEAKTAWTARQAIRDEFNRVRDEERRSTGERVQSERRREVLAAYHEYADEVRERIPDFDKVLSTANVNIKQELGDEIISSEKSALLQYHLAKNPDKVRELNQLSGRELAREIGRLEAKVHLPTAKKATDAQAPPSEVKGSASPPVDHQTGPDDMNAYVAWRKKQAKG